MKILVAIANHGCKNKRYIEQLFSAYRAMSFCVDIVVLSDVPKAYGHDIEVLVGAPTQDPWSLPFGHKALFADRIDDYDLFIYSEDDTLIEQPHIEAFLRATDVLPENCIAGFLRYEQDAKGRRYCSSMHSHYHWDVASVHAVGGYTYAYYTNEHAASYVLTRRQLKRAIDSGGFLVEAHEGQYDLLCTAATDPYTQCGFTKVLMISHIEEFLLPHLPNQYLGQMGLEYDDMLKVTERLAACPDQSSKQLIPGRTGFPGYQWEMSYHSPVCDEIIERTDPNAVDILSVGVGQGKTEGRLVEKGYSVSAIALDDVIGASAVLRGMHVLPADIDEAIDLLQGRQFDVLILQDILCYLEAPLDALEKLVSLLKRDGQLLITVLNLDSVKSRRVKALCHQDRISYTALTEKDLMKWTKLNGFRGTEVDYYGFTPKAKSIRRLMGSVLDPYISRRMILSTVKDEPS